VKHFSPLIENKPSWLAILTNNSFSVPEIENLSFWRPNSDLVPSVLTIRHLEAIPVAVFTDNRARQNFPTQEQSTNVQFGVISFPPKRAYPVFVAHPRDYLPVAWQA
jgi:hypothetical protein